MIKIDYHDVENPSHWHLKRLIAWLDDQTGVPHDTKYRLFKYEDDPNGYVIVERPCQNEYNELPEFTASAREIGWYDHSRVLCGPGWSYDERVDMTIDEYSRSTNLYHHEFHFEDETLCMMFKLVMHEWQNDHLTEWQ